MKRTSRKPFRLSDSLQRHLNAYALAASAAGVGMLALAQPAEAKIIYTPAHRWLPINHYYYLDLNQHGIWDFRLHLLSGMANTTYNSFSDTALYLSGRQGNGVAGSHTTYGNGAYALPAGRQIGPGLHFYGNAFMAARTRIVGNTEWRCFGTWNNRKNRYLGFSFQIKGKTHYGWARLSESCNSKPPRGGMRALLTGDAYETVPNKPIIAGKTKGPDVITLEPGTLGRLALGSVGLAAGRLGK